MKIVDQKNFAAGSMYLVFGCVVSVWSLDFQIGSAARMGPGYFPLAVGLALVVTGLVVLFGAVGTGAAVAGIGALNMQPVLTVAAGVIAFGLLIRAGGLILAVPALIGISAFADPGRSGRTILIAIAVLLPLTWLVFAAVLGLQLRLLPAFVGL